MYAGGSAARLERAFAELRRDTHGQTKRRYVRAT
ncbi:hypothetical protein Clst_2602 [Thermoclostridium stercorarium subsp. stercorarium DSM 8532]|nr:hypothetical protein Clst_2602 [Thermoclostridium stercorarium subsp. stercorarium DSM 8532]